MDDFEKEMKLLTIDESADHLGQLEEILNTKDYNEINSDDIDTIFRIAHSIKGNTRASGYEEIAEISHSYESKLSKVKEAGNGFTEEMYNLSLVYLDTLNDAISILKNDIEAKLDLGKFKNALVNPIRVSLAAEVPTEEILKDGEAPNIQQIQAQPETESSRKVLNLNKVENSKDEIENTKEVKKGAMHILIVDDDLDIQEVVKDHIETRFEDVSFVLKANGQDALNAVADDKFDMIICDFMMPILDGVSFIELMRSHKGLNQYTPIIFLSGYRPSVDGSSSVWENVFFMDKPFNPNKLIYYIKCGISAKAA